MGCLDSKVAVVTGAATGIGLAIAARFVEEGARTVLADIDRRVVDVATRFGDRAVGTVVDVTDSAQVAGMIGTAVSHFGTVDVLCNNAGTESAHVPMTECPDEEFDRVVAVNLRGTFLGMKHALPIMTERGSGSIVNIASLLASRIMPTQGPYCSSKAGVVQLTKVAAWEVGRHNVRVNAVSPGGVLTEMAERIFEGDPGAYERYLSKHALGRLAAPAEIAAVVTFLAGDQSSFVTGTTVDVDGGWSAIA